MKKKISVFLILSLLIGTMNFTVFAQTNPSNTSTPKVTFLNIKLKNIGQYSEGLCPVQDFNSGMWGYIDITGKYKIKPQYYEAGPFSENLAAVKNSSGFYDFIDKTGKIVIKSNYTSILPRFASEFSGFKNGLALVTSDNKQYFLIDKKGTVIKKLDSGLNYNLQLNRFIKRGNIVTVFQENNTIYNDRYEKIATLPGNTNRALFNNSSKFLAFDDVDYNGKGTGMAIYDAKGKKIFDQSKIAGMDNTYSYKFGITDDYIVIQRNVNGIQTSAVYDYNGKVIINYSYKEICPIDKNIFIVENNGGNLAVIDKSGKQIVPFSYNIKFFNRHAVSKIGDYYTDVKKFNIISFIYENAKGTTKYQYYDITGNKIVDSIPLFINGYYVNSIDFSYDRGKSGIYYFLNTSNYNMSIFNNKGKEISKIDMISASILNISGMKYFDTFDGASRDSFIKDNFIPTMTKDRSGMTFAIVK